MSTPSCLTTRRLPAFDAELGGERKRVVENVKTLVTD
jgi:hypothetical protein